MAAEVQISRLDVLAAVAAVGVVGAALFAPQAVVLAALVNVLIAGLSVFVGSRAITSDAAGNVADPIDDYQILDKLSAGGMGEVFRARQIQLGRPVALKRIQPKRLGEEEKSRFRREARVLSALSNPHTINVFDAGIQRDATLFYVMELLDGLNLTQLVRREGTLSPARVIHIMHQTTLSLHEAHGRGLVHRDLNPSNMMVCRYGGEYDFVKVLDFGLVKSVEPEQQVESGDFVREAGAVPGTPAFVAPESISTSGAPTPRVDIYALGAVGHFALTGRYLFDADSPVAMARAHLHERPRSVSEISPRDVPPRLEQLIMRCLEKNPDDRPQSAEELLSILDELRAEHPWTRADAEACWREVPQPTADVEQPLLPSDAAAHDVGAPPRPS